MMIIRGQAHLGVSAHSARGHTLPRARTIHIRSSTTEGESSAQGSEQPQQPPVDPLAAMGKPRMKAESSECGRAVGHSSESFVHLVSHASCSCIEELAHAPHFIENGTVRGVSCFN